MKSILFILLLVIIVTMPVYAQEDDIAVIFNIGFLGIGRNFPMDDDYNSEVTISLLNIGIKYKPINIGLELSPFKHFISLDSGGQVQSFFNLNLYWDTISAFDGAFYLGTFASINYFFVWENIYWDRYIFTIGVRTGLRSYIGGIYYDIFSAEMGYRNINGTSKFFIGARIDIPSLIYMIITGKRAEKSRD